MTTRALYREAVGPYESDGWIRAADQPPPGPDRLYYLTFQDAQSNTGVAKDDHVDQLTRGANA